MSKTNPVREGFSTVTPYLYLRGADRAIEFYIQAFGASEVMRLQDPSGKIMYASLRIAGSMITLSDEFPEMGIRGPQTLGGSPVPLLLYVEDADIFLDRATGAGAKVLKPIQDQFFGDRSGVIEDPFGHVWMIATQKEVISQDEMLRRFRAMLG